MNFEEVAKGVYSTAIIVIGAGALWRAPDMFRAMRHHTAAMDRQSEAMNKRAEADELMARQLGDLRVAQVQQEGLLRQVLDLLRDYLVPRHYRPSERPDTPPSRGRLTTLPYSRDDE